MLPPFGCSRRAHVLFTLFGFFLPIDNWYYIHVYMYDLNAINSAAELDFNNIPVTSWRSVLLAEETGVHGENHRPATSQ